MTTCISRRELGRSALGAWFASVAAGANAAIAGVGRNRWRNEFPILQDRGGTPAIYLDSAATTQRPNPVIRALTNFYERDNANPSAALHQGARRAHELFEAARATVARFINAKTPDEIVWTRGTTEGVNLVATAWAERELRRGDEILLTVSEHASNLLPWTQAAKRAGASVRFADVDDAGRISLTDVVRKLNARTRMLAFSHVSNVVGFINPAAELCELARRHGALTFVDAAQSAPHVPIDVQAMGCDFLAFSSHKMLGPMGVGVLWGRHELLERMTPYQSGSNMAHDVDTDAAEWEHGARKFGAGTPNVSGAIGLASAIEFLNSLGRDAIESHERALVQHGLARLAEVRGLKLLGPAESENRLPVFSFVLDGVSPPDVMKFLDTRGIAVRAGDLAALPLLKHFGVTRAVRASCYLYTEIAELDAMVQTLHEMEASREGKRR
jgi:cysteine desulfurase/selenocysteine lyase